MKSEVLSGEEARAALLRGVDRVADAVCGSLGPRGRNTFLSRRIGAPVVSASGVSVAREITLPNAYENMGAQLMREVSGKTGDEVGDGTTTAILLARAMLREAVKCVAAGANPVALKRGMQQARETAEQAIRLSAHPLRSSEELARICTVSTGDEEVGRLIAGLYEALPRDPVISVEESKGVRTTAEIIEGMAFDRGYMTPYMITDQAQQLAVLEEPYLFLTDQSITGVLELKAAVESCSKRRSPLFIVAPSVSTEVLAALVKTRMQQGFLCVCVKAPSLKERMRDLLEDMAVLTGGVVIREEKGMRLADTTISQLGRARKIIVSKDKTTILGGKGEPKAIEARVQHIQHELARAEFDFDILKLRERVGWLAGGVGVLRVGAYGEAELQEKKQRAEAAVSAAGAAQREGVVDGGGKAFLAAAQAVQRLCDRLEGDERSGAALIARALCAPACQLAENAGLEGAVMRNTLIRCDDSVRAFDRLQEYEHNLPEEGILDPAAVCISALAHAASVACAVVTSEVLLAIQP